MKKVTDALLLFLCFALVFSVGFAGHLVVAKPGKVVIKRDHYGTPHIYAKTLYGLFYGYGYAIAQDRLYQMELAKRSAQGSVSEVLGSDYIEFDKKIRSNFSPQSVMSQLSGITPDERRIFEGYAHGMNAWILEIQKNPDILMPKQFLDNGFNPGLWTGFDVAMIFIGSMGNRFGDFNTELENQRLLNALIERHGVDNGRALFDLLNPLENGGAPTTIAANENVKKQPAASVNFAPTLQMAKVDKADIPKFDGFSNIIVVGSKKADGAKSILLNGPQFGWFMPAYTYSVGLHGAGFDLVGNTPFGYPVVMFGYNSDISWGSTWGAADVVDIYRETLNPNNPHEYLFNGKYLAMKRRLETIKVKNGKPEILELWSTVHGPVIGFDEKRHVAYSKKRSWAGREIDTLLGWIRSTASRSYEEWLDQASHSAMNINWYYADKNGNIGYVLTGAYPRRDPRHDNRLPVSGTGDREWLGIKPFKENPRIYNPSTGYIANWNNRPAMEVGNPDMFWYSWSRADRVEVLTKELSAKERFTPEDIRTIISNAAFADPNAPYFIPFILRATKELGAKNPLRWGALTLAKWDGFSQDRDQDCHYDETATAIFRTWLPLFLQKTLADDLGKTYFPWFASAGYPSEKSPMLNSLNIQTGTKAVYEALSGNFSRYDIFNGHDPQALIRETLQSALEQLRERFGDNPVKWRLPVAINEFTHKNFLGIPQAGINEVMHTSIAMNRGSENNLTVFTDQGVIGFEAVAPGQSGFIAPNGSKSLYYNNQLELYENFKYKRTWLDETDVTANSTFEITLNY